MTNPLHTNTHFVLIKGAYTYLLFLLIVVELVFYAYFRWILIPRANDITKRKSEPYRDYPTSHRHVLFLRILNRIEDRCKQMNKTFGDEFTLFLSRWFNDTRQCNTHHFFKEELDVFFSWAFFDKNYVDLNPIEKQEINRMYDILQERHGIRYQSRSDGIPESHSRSPLQPKCMTLEPVDSLHRPFVIYLLVGVGRILSHLLLRVLGFQRYTAVDETACIDKMASRQLVYWFKPSSQSLKSSEQETILFFHGIAPAGLLFYIPLLYNTFCNHALGSPSKNILLFQNKPITCSMSFEALNELSTVTCIRSILDKHLSLGSSSSNVNESMRESSPNLCLIGHSFGSCQVSWLLYSPLIIPYVRKIVLLDPVSILLSEPDVMNNFLYNRSSSTLPKVYSKELSLRKLLIRLVASSELFTEHYLRRHFCWYNSELWLEDVPESIEIIIYLSERDDIVNSKKIQDEIKMIHNKQPNKASKIKALCWKDVGHASCLTNPKLWQDIANGWHSSNHTKQD